MLTSDYRPEVEIRPFCACAMKNAQYNPYLWTNRGNFRVLKEIGVEEQDGDIRFYTRSGNTDLSLTHHASGHNYLSHSYSIQHGTDYKIGLRLPVCQCICPSASTLTVAFLDRFSPKLAQM